MRLATVDHISNSIANWRTVVIDTLQVILRRLFKKAYEQSLDPNAPLTNPKLTVHFERPGKNFPPDTLTGACLNVTLVDVRENQKLRKNDRVTIRTDREHFTTQVAAQLDCHYLATAWIKGAETPHIEAQQERRLLYEAAAAMLRHSPIDVRTVLDVPLTFPQPEEASADDWHELRAILNHPHEDDPSQTVSDMEFSNLKQDSVLLSRQLPLEALPPEGYSKLPEFWGLMETNAQWRPAVYFIVTIPVERLRWPRGPEVRSINTTIINLSAKRTIPNEPDKQPSDRELFYKIGGRITRAGKPAPSVTVVLTGSGKRVGHLPHNPLDVSVKQQTVTGDDGQYQFTLVTDGIVPDYRDWTWTVQVEGINHTLPTPIAAHTLSSFDIDL